MWGCLSVLPCVPWQKVARGLCLALSTMSTFAVIFCIMTKVMTSGDGGADHPIARAGMLVREVVTGDPPTRTSTPKLIVK